MSTLKVANITTSNNSENLVLSTGNTSGSRILVPASGDLIVGANSTFNNMVVNSTGITISGNVRVSSVDANGSLGTSGQVLTSSGTGNVYWAAPAATITAVNAGTGLSGGGSSGSLTLSVNSSYVATQVVNNTFTGVQTFSANATFGANANFNGTSTFNALMNLKQAIALNGATGSAGDYLTSSGGGVPYWTTPTTAGGALSTKFTAFTSTGTSTFTKDPNMLFAQVICIGGGGGGGGATGTAVSNGAMAGSGGGGGGIAIRWLNSSEIGATSNVVVGAGGSGGTSSTNAGGTGGNTTFAIGTGTLINGRGGGGATGNTIGGGGTAQNGSINVQGGDGYMGFPLGLFASQRSGPSGAGGSSGMAFGAGGAPVISAAGGGSTGNNGVLYGGGGGGASRANTASSSTGGTGANGACFVIEFLSV